MILVDCQRKEFIIFRNKGLMIRDIQNKTQVIMYLLD